MQSWEDTEMVGNVCHSQDELRCRSIWEYVYGGAKGTSLTYTATKQETEDLYCGIF